MIGTDRKYWSEMVLCFRAAIPSLERRSFSVWDPSSVDYESTSSTLIATNYPTLWRDLDRLICLVSIARNVVTKSLLAQDLAAECVFEDEIFRLINCCVRVTARGYEGDAGTGDEEKWQWIVGAYKKLLIVSLQFLNNLVAQNERRKLMLWVSLFDNMSDASIANAANGHDRNSANLTMPLPPLSTNDILVALGEPSPSKVDPAADVLRIKRLLTPAAPLGETRPSRPVSGYVLYVKNHSERVKEECGPLATPAEVAMELSKQWAQISDEHRKAWSTRYDELMLKYEHDLELYNEARKSRAVEKSQIDQVAIRIAKIEASLNQSMKRDVPHVAPLDIPLVGTDPPSQPVLLSFGPCDASSSDYKMHISAAEGSRILESGKAELMKRLDDPVSPRPDDPLSPSELEHLETASAPEISTRSFPEDDEPSSRLATTDRFNRTKEAFLRVAEQAKLKAEQDRRARVEQEAEPEPESDAERSEDEDYGSSTEDGRGLLTDVPLILGPSEIEVLPMIIMSGIVPPAKPPGDAQQDHDAVINMHTVRCHLLLAQDNGKNLLRELLIFVAAWDLRDEELYFKFMLKIMEAILVNGLMPYAYHAFRE